MLVKDDHTTTDRAAIQRIVARAQAGDSAAFGEIYERFDGVVRQHVGRICVDPHEAEDITQQVFTKLFTCIGQYRSREQPFHHWLARVARNCAIDAVRRRRPLPVDDIWEGAADAHASDAEVVDGLRCALAGLPLEQRQIVLMRHLIGLSPDEIASQTGRTTAAVHGLHFRARRRLQGRLRALGMAPTTLARAA